MTFPIVDMKRTGRNIAALREQRGLSVSQLQRLMGFATPQAIYSSTARRSPRWTIWSRSRRYSPCP